MRGISKITWLPILMGITILAIIAFQVFWLKGTYEREQRTLEMRSNFMFRETIHNLQASRLDADIAIRSDTANVAAPAAPPQMYRERSDREQGSADPKVISMIESLRERVTDSLRQKGLSLDSLRKASPHHGRLLRFLYEMDAVQDSLPLMDITKAYEQRQVQQNVEVPFRVVRFNRGQQEGRRAFNEVTLGFANPITYQLQVYNTGPYLLRRIMAPIVLSFFIVGFTLLSFILLYRNMVRQRRLAEIKNEFISNITHELKTPIATVSVAIEALRSFNASMDAQRTKEYLDISHNELQRLSLLVDKVLKLSIFEKKEVDLKYERMDMQDLVAEVMASMRLQFEKYRAEVTVQSEGNTILEGDRLHLVSVIFNMLDNALKYSKEKPRIKVLIRGGESSVQLHVADSGIGIPKEYHQKVFDKFFRVPTGNLHNAKGYGLGLSYVAHVVQKHQGVIRVESTEGSGSRFVITLPKKSA